MTVNTRRLTVSGLSVVGAAHAATHGAVAVTDAALVQPLARAQHVVTPGRLSATEQHNNRLAGDSQWQMVFAFSNRSIILL